MIVRIHADESCLGNGQPGATPGGAGALVEYGTDDNTEARDFWLSAADTTNNRMAIAGAAHVLEALRRPCEVEYVSDSVYLVKGMSEWMAGWLRKGKLDNGKVANADLWKRLNAAARRHAITWRWVRGHNGHDRNEYADRLAVRAAKTQTASDGLITSGFAAWLASGRPASLTAPAG